MKTNKANHQREPIVHDPSGIVPDNRDLSGKFSHALQGPKHTNSIVRSRHGTVRKRRCCSGAESVEAPH
jgi:hypothetical protein